MKWFHGNVSSRQATLQERPEILHTVGVYAAANVFNSMIDDLMLVLIFQAAIASEFISEKSGSGFNMLSDDRVQSGFDAICDDLSANAATTLQHSHNDDFVVCGLSLSGEAASLYALV